MKKLAQTLRTAKAKAAIAATSLLVAAQSYGIETQDITDAYTSGNSAVSVTTAGMITLVAGVVGVGLVVGMLRKL
ncbi:hypothetical protein Misp06_01086 [Microbulbifer sp. NBRC 101763]|uniref:hypothetical protein n=1 Tax=Microbulbifer sp. NBRC 101763 TaxID=1113820 RepID=UPI0030A2C128